MIESTSAGASGGGVRGLYANTGNGLQAKSVQNRDMGHPGCIKI
jgi:hypothetical protein